MKKSGMIAFFVLGMTSFCAMTLTSFVSFEGKGNAELTISKGKEYNPEGCSSCGKKKKKKSHTQTTEKFGF